MVIPMKVMKVTTVMKKKSTSIIAKGRFAKAQVLNGSKTKTSGGITRDGITKNKFGRIVSKKKSLVSKRRYAGSKLEAWNKALSTARKSLGVSGFLAVNGSATGKAVYAKAKAIYAIYTE
mmetsp:Transcript_37217/g.67825  ORF Transcript_37217/g.67825 Transcript_37217/m.67825 type:complete len:120 (-) Transcript_37217:215-574(-)